MQRFVQNKSRHAQRGVVFYLFVVFTLMAMTALVVGVGGAAWRNAARERDAQRILQDAKRLVLAHLLNADIELTPRRLGEWKRFPDLPTPTSPGYDGNAETVGCATRTWVPGQPMQAVSTSAANARCFGRLPWREMSLALDNPSGADEAGLVPWVIFSPNLATTVTCLKDLNPLVLSKTFVAYACPAAPPYPWLTVLDERGNLLSDRVAFVLILPGPALPGQVRGAAAGPAAYLDSVTIAPGCPTPCQPGTYNNARYNQPNNQPTVLIRAPVGGTAVERSTTYTQPYMFNDRLIYVTADELFWVLEQRARTELVNALMTFRTAKGYFPFASAMNTGDDKCVMGKRFGHVPMNPDTCESPSLGSWLTNAGWHRYFIYAVSSRCVSSNSACTPPGLMVDGVNTTNALLLAPGTAITTAPFAPSRGAAQTPLIGLNLSPNAADYLDSTENAGGAPDVFVTPSTQPPPHNDLLKIVE